MSQKINVRKENINERDDKQSQLGTFSFLGMSKFEKSYHLGGCLVKQFNKNNLIILMVWIKKKQQLTYF